VLGHHLATGEEPRRWGTGHPDIVPYQVFAARDGHLVVAVGNDAQFERLMAVLRLDMDPRFATNEDRLEAREELVPLLAVQIGERSRDELVAALTAADVPAGAVNAVSEALAAMEAAHDGEWTQTADGMRLAPDPIRIDGQRLPLRAPPPRFGRDTEAILAEAGLSAGEISALRAEGVLG
jgi:crotonobetainyl-CoA:carnitine CoA-transferase CaiB-like acyl-CoA transferase